MSCRVILTLYMFVLLLSRTGAETAQVIPSFPQCVHRLVRDQDRRLFQKGSAIDDAARTLQICADLGSQLSSADLSKPSVRLAIALFLFSGGQPIKASASIKTNESGTEGQLLRAATLYAQGRLAKIDKQFLELNASQFSPILAAHVALAQGVIASQANPVRATGCFEKASLFLPRSFVDEAALRAIALFSLKGKDKKGAAFSISRYLRRFSGSEKVSAFTQDISEALLALPEEEVLTILSELARHRDRISNPGVSEILLLLAHKSALRGKPAITLTAAQSATALLSPNSLKQQQAAVYEGIALILTGNDEQGMFRLRSTNTESLSVDDRTLVASAIEIASSMSAEAGRSGWHWPRPRLTKRRFEPNRILNNVTASLKAADTVMAELK